MSEWRERAACRDADPAIFFLSKGDNGKVRAARVYCNACPVRVHCLDYAITLRLTSGIWGGLTYPQRRRIWQEAA
jgi:WhiB family redox-sensing transcriptional regulator